MPKEEEKLHHASMRIFLEHEKWIEEKSIRDEARGWGKCRWSQKEMELTDEIVESAKAM